MKRTLLKALTLGLMTGALASCAKDEAFEPNGGVSPALSQPFIVGIEATQGAKESTTRASYGEQGEFSWSAGDIFTLGYCADFKDADSNISSNSLYTTDFTTQDSGKTAYFTGEVMPFVGDTTVCACYSGNPDAGSWLMSNIDFSKKTILASEEFLAGWDNTPNATPTISERAMGLMVATAEDATIESEEKVNIPALNFKQVASFFQIEITDHPDDRSIVYISLLPISIAEECVENDNWDLDDLKTFVSEAEFSMETGEMVKVISNEGKIGFEIDRDYNHANTFFTIPIFPNNTNEVTEDLTFLMDVKDDDGAFYSYYIDLGKGINFKRNTIHRHSAVSWNDMKCFTYSAVIPLSKFDDPAYLPTVMEWIIDCEGDTDLSKSDVEGLRRALSNNTYADKDITLTFRGISSIGAEAFMGELPALKSVFIENTDELCLGDAAFADNSYLEGFFTSYEYNNNTKATLGKGVFKGCTSLRDFSITTDEYPDNTFMGCESLQWCSLDVKKIGKSAFEGCSSFLYNDVATEIPLPLTDVQEIGERAFYNCNHFSQLYLQYQETDGLTYLGAEAFNYDSNSSGSAPYTAGMVLYTNSTMQNKVKNKTLTVGSTSYTFNTIFVNGVEQNEDTTDDNYNQPSTGNDAQVEIL